MQSTLAIIAFADCVVEAIGIVIVAVALMGFIGLSEMQQHRTHQVPEPTSVSSIALA